MKIVALIPARSGSKRLKNKNSKKLFGKPLITWTIKTALNVKEISKVFVSTNDKKIINICKKYDVQVPWKRPKKLCGDKVNTASIALHFLRWYEKRYSQPDAILLLQPTSPFRKKSSIIKAINTFKKNKNHAVVSFYLINKKNADLIFFKNTKTLTTAKKIKYDQTLKLNGSIYLTCPKNLKKYKSFFKPSIIPLIQNTSKESIDIDTYEDWNIAKKIK